MTRSFAVQQKASALNYQKHEGSRVPLPHKPEDGPWRTFTCLNSLRGVEQALHLVLVDAFGSEQILTGEDEE